MDSIEVINALSALAQPTRLETFRLLVSRESDGIAAGELARLVRTPQNTMSAHLAILARAGLVRGERLSRSIIYRADLHRFREVSLFLLKDCCGGRPEICAPLIADLTPVVLPRVPPMTDRAFNVLFLCTGNTARSVLAESILRKDGAGRFCAFSAGSQPKGIVNPFALKVLGAFDYPTDGFRSKSWDEFATPDAPRMDFVFTVCDDAAGETCPSGRANP
jgi:ArsR family transcriptional regulator, arsenate/arsenite/antimonite-responsive transcriptional repressor / arsenate reductase (thioredoxin)